MNPPDPPAAPRGDIPPGLDAGLSMPTTDGPGPPSGEPMRLRLRDSADLLAALPHLLGFVPSASLVLIAIRSEGGRTRIGAVVRIDLPGPGDVPAVAAAAMRRMGRRGTEEVAAVVVGDGTPSDGPGGPGDPDEPPHAELVEAVEALCAAVRIPVRVRLWVPRIAAGARWCCYPPCGCSGVLPDPGSTVAALASTMFGHVTFGSREEVAALVRPDPQAAGGGSPRRRRLIDEALGVAALDRELAGLPAARRRDVDALRRAAAELAGGGVLGDAEVARLAAALCDPGVRDPCLGFSLGDSGVAPPSAETLWTVLVRAVPAPEVAEPATLLACAALARGGGALVGAALERAAVADPGHTLSGLVTSLLDTGIDQTEFLAWMRSGSSAAVAALGPPDR